MPKLHWNVYAKRTRESARLPEYQTGGSAGADCYAAERTPIAAGARAKVPLGIALHLPERMEAQVRPRSGNSLKGIDVLLGTIDSDYRSEVSAIVWNNTGAPIVVQKGDRICQLVVQQVDQAKFYEVDDIAETGRGGFGSTGAA